MYTLALFYAVGFAMGWYLKSCPKFKTGDRVRLKKMPIDGCGRVEHIRWHHFTWKWTYWVLWEQGGDGYYFAKDLMKP